VLLWSQLFRYRLRRSPVRKQEESESPPKQLTSRYQVPTSIRRSPTTSQFSRLTLGHDPTVETSRATGRTPDRLIVGTVLAGSLSAALLSLLLAPLIILLSFVLAFPLSPFSLFNTLPIGAFSLFLALPLVALGPLRFCLQRPRSSVPSPHSATRHASEPGRTSHRCIGINRGARCTHDNSHAPAHICCRPGHVRRRQWRPRSWCTGGNARLISGHSVGRLPLFLASRRRATSRPLPAGVGSCPFDAGTRFFGAMVWDYIGGVSEHDSVTVRSPIFDATHHEPIRNCISKDHPGWDGCGHLGLAPCQGGGPRR
jgi:hypothetical protein